MSIPSSILNRHVEPRLREALEASRVVFLNGARQAGKTTLVRKLGNELRAAYITLDDRIAREVALSEPEELIDREGALIIDEVQRGGEDLLLAIKASVDRDDRPGRFLLTGSTRFLTVPSLSESLAGRLELVDLWPLSQGEIEQRPDSLLDRLFSSAGVLRRSRPSTLSLRDALERVCRGGFPEAVARSARARDRWFESYARTLTERDVVENSNLQRVADLPALVRHLAARTAAEINISSLARDLGIPRTTLSAYLPLLETVFLAFRLPAWSRNITSKLVKQAKLHFTDSGLAAHLVGASPDSLSRPAAPMTGPLLETFAVSELARQRTWARTACSLHHFRDRAGAEVDVILEARDGRVAAVEVKAGRSVGRNELRALALVRDRLGESFVNGVVLYLGDEVRPLGDRLTALPLSALWE